MSVVERIILMMQKQLEVAKDEYKNAPDDDRQFEFGVLTGIENCLSTAQAMAEGF